MFASSHNTFALIIYRLYILWGDEVLLPARKVFQEGKESLFPPENVFQGNRHHLTGRAWCDENGGRGQAPPLRNYGFCCTKGVIPFVRTHVLDDT